MRGRHPGGAGTERLTGGLIAAGRTLTRSSDLPVNASVFSDARLTPARSEVEHGACLPATHATLSVRRSNSIGLR